MRDKKNKKIEITVTLDPENIPEAIYWQADDAGSDTPQKVAAFLLSLWDSDKKSALAIDLWSKEMLVGDMNILIYQTLRRLADTCERATHEKENAELLRKAAHEFGAKVKLLK